MSAHALCQGDSGGHICSLWLHALCQASCIPSLPSQSSQFTSTCLDHYCAISLLSLATHRLNQNKATAKFKQMAAVLFIPFFSLSFMYYRKSHDQTYLSALLSSASTIAANGVQVPSHHWTSTGHNPSYVNWALSRDTLG